MNQGKLEVVKQGMARVNINILGISELQWTGMGEFKSDDHYIYHCEQESLLGPPLENNPEIPPSSRDEGLRLLHGLETNLAASLQTPQEA